jgi:hypothetical protein
MAKKAMQPNPFVGLWHIVSMDAWDEDYLNAEVQAFIELEENGTGRFQFGYVQGYMDWQAVIRDEEPADAGRTLHDEQRPALLPDFHSVVLLSDGDLEPGCWVAYGGKTHREGDGEQESGRDCCVDGTSLKVRFHRRAGRCNLEAQTRRLNRGNSCRIGVSSINWFNRRVSCRKLGAPHQQQEHHNLNLPTYTLVGRKHVKGRLFRSLWQDP